ncbi:MAG: flagellin [Vicinamibacterales bacterium]
MASFSVVSNISAANAQANLTITNLGLQKALTRVSSGFRINASGDDAAGLAVANSYRSQQAVLNQGIRNANDGLSTLQIQDGALNNIATLLDRLSVLATPTASASSGVDRTTLDAEFETCSRKSTVRRRWQVWTTPGASRCSSATTAPAVWWAARSARPSTNTLGINGFSLSSATNAQTAVSTIASAVSTLGTTPGRVGMQNRLSYAIGLASTQVVSIKAAESRIRDANVAESANLTRYNILTQSGIAATLAQANQANGSVLSLLR